MEFAPIFLGFAFLVWFVVSLFLLVAPKKRKKAKLHIKLSAAGFVASLLVFAFVSIPATINRQDTESRAIGFADRADQEAAEKAGAKSATEWAPVKAKLQADRLAQKAADEAAKKEAETKAADEAAKKAADEVDKVAALKKVEDDKCRVDLQCMGKKAVEDVSAQCQIAIEKLAKFQSEWTGGPKFSHYKWAKKPGGAIIIIGDQIKFQNGFGAWGNMVYSCEYDDVKNTYSVNAAPGRL